MVTPDELRQELAAARADFAAAIAIAGAAWETAPAAGEGEASWSPRQAAEHCISADVMYASAVCIACGYPGLERQTYSFGSNVEAEEGRLQASALADGRLKYVTETDLEKKNQRGNSVADMIRANTAHFRDHAAQIRAVAGA